MSRSTTPASAEPTPEKTPPAPAPATPAPADEPAANPETVSDEITVYVTDENDGLTSIDDVEDDTETVVHEDDEEWSYPDLEENAQLLDAKTEAAAS